MKKTISAFIVLCLMAAPALALAQGATVDAGVTANVSAAGAQADVTAHGTVKASVIAKAKDRANQEITRRIDNLNKLAARISETERLTQNAKTSISSSISAQVAALTSLQTQIAGEASTTGLRSEIKSVVLSYRIYALIMPQIALIASADRIVTVTDMLNIFGGKLEARLSAAGAASTTANTAALADMKAKIADAENKANAAVTEVAALKPDNGDKATMQSNLSALKDARSKILAAQQDLVAARKDAKIVLQVLQVNASASAAASTTPSAATNGSQGQ